MELILHYLCFLLSLFELLFFNFCAVQQLIHLPIAGNGGEVTSSDLLLGIWSEVDSPGHKILAALGFNNDKAKELESLISEPGFVDE